MDDKQQTSQWPDENDLAKRFFVFAMIGVVVFVAVAALLSSFASG